MGHGSPLPGNGPGALDAGRRAPAPLGAYLQWTVVTPGFMEGNILPTSYWIGDDVVQIDRILEESSVEGEAYWRVATQQGERFLVRRGRRWYLAGGP